MSLFDFVAAEFLDYLTRQSPHIREHARCGANINGAELFTQAIPVHIADIFARGAQDGDELRASIK